MPHLVMKKVIQRPGSALQQQRIGVKECRRRVCLGSGEDAFLLSADSVYVSVSLSVLLIFEFVDPRRHVHASIFSSFW